MAMSRRKQLHPKSLKEGDETTFVLPDELKCDEESHDIIARIDIEQGHRFGPFPAIEVPSRPQRLSSDSDSTNGSGMIVQIDNETIEHRTQSFQLLDNKHNWLARCSISNNYSPNLNIIFQDDEIFAILIESITIGTRIGFDGIILPKVNNMEDSQVKQEAKLNMNSSTNDIKVKEEPVESEEDEQQQQTTTTTTDLSASAIKSELAIITINTSKSKKLYPLVFTCDDCGIRYSNRSTLDAHRQHYCTKREAIPSITTKSHSTDSTMTVKIKSMKRKHMDINDSSPSKRLSSSSSSSSSSTTANDTYCSECDISFSKPDNLIQHKLYYCRTKSSLRQINEPNIPAPDSFRPPIPFDRPIQIGQFIYIPVPIVPSHIDNNDRSVSPPDHDNKPLDLSKPKKANDECEQRRQKSTNSSTSPLDLSIEKPTNLFNLLNSSSTTKVTNPVQQQIYECDYCSIRFSTLKTLHAHQENYCIEYRKQKKSGTPTNETKSTNNDTNRSQSPSLSSSTISKVVPLSPNDSLNSSHLPPHRSSPFMCRLCKYRGNTLRGMRMHFKFHLSNNEPCTDDDIIITSTINNNLSSLTTPSSQLLLKCTICSAMFDHEDTLLNHMKCVHTKESVLECSECESRFCSKWNLLRHMKLTHTNIKCDEEEQQQDDNNDEHKTVIESPFIINGLNTEQKMEEDQDLSSSSSSSSSSNDKSSDSVNLTRNVLIESMDMNKTTKISNSLLIKKKFACPYCHIKFGSIDTLKQHMTNYCSSRPTTNDDLRNTKKNKNNTDTYCSSCQIPFRHKSSYDAHKMYYCRSNNKAHVKIQA